MAEPPTLRELLSTGPTRQRLRWALRIVTPWGIEWWLWRGGVRRLRRRIRARVAPATPPPASRYEAVIGFLSERGLAEHEVREGSVPEASLQFTAAQLAAHLPTGRPVRALHVGNFVGVSLCHLSWLLREHHQDSVVVSVDPNIAHRGIADPQSHVLALLDHFRLLSANVVITGFSLERSEVTSEAEYLDAMACEEVLAGLATVGAQFDLAFLDGSHEHDHLRREVQATRRLLTEGGVLVLDDVADWPGVAAVLDELRVAESWHLVADDGRVGIVRAG